MKHQLNMSKKLSFVKRIWENMGMKAWLPAVICICVVMVGATGLTYSWLSSLYTGQEQVVVTTGTTPPIQMDMWLYTTAEEALAEGGPEGWVHHSITAVDGSEVLTIPGAVNFEAAGNSNQISCQIKDLHLGTIDDLGQVQKDNVVYCRFRINGAAQGKRLSLHISLPSAGAISTYDIAGNAVTADKLNELITLNASQPLYQYQCHVVNQETDPISNVNFDVIFNNNMLTQGTVNGIPDPNMYTMTLDLSGDTAYDGDYYVYLKIYPNLYAVGKAASILYESGTAIITADWNWNIEVY